MKFQDGRPPENAKRIYAWRDLPPANKAETFTIHEQGKKPRLMTLKGKRAVVMMGLLRSPLYAASYARIGDHVYHLKADHGVDIETLMYRNDPETGRDKFGVYFLKSFVTRVDTQQEAA